MPDAPCFLRAQVHKRINRYHRCVGLFSCVLQRIFSRPSSFLGGLGIHAELLLRYNGSSFALRKIFGAGIYGNCAKQREAQRLASVPVQLNSATKGRLCILREIASRRSICNWDNPASPCRKRSPSGYRRSAKSAEFGRVRPSSAEFGEFGRVRLEFGRLKL